MPPAAAPPPEILPPGYTQVRLLGRGQFGRVYEVAGPGGFSSALKVVNNPSKGEVEFLKEFKSLTTMRQVRPHPHIVPIQGVWLRTQTGEFLTDAHQVDVESLASADMDLLILMELGQKTLGDRFKECRKDGHRGVPAKELLRYMDGAGKGLDYLNSEAHDLGGGHPSRIIHCDVKPANLLVFGGGMAKVADYGVARVVGAAARATTAGGSPAYAPPELHGRAGPHPTSDQYSLAITFYELLTGLLPLEAGTALEAILAHANGELDFSKAGPNVQGVLRVATDRTCDRRYPTCEEFVDALKDAARADDPGAFGASVASQGASSGIPFPGDRRPLSRPPSSHDPLKASTIPPGASPTGTLAEPPPARRSSQPVLPAAKKSDPHPGRTPVPPPKKDTDAGAGAGTVLMPADHYPTPPPGAIPPGLFETSAFEPPPPSGAFPAVAGPAEPEAKAPWEVGTITEAPQPAWLNRPASAAVPVQGLVGPAPGKSKTPVLVGIAVGIIGVAAVGATVFSFLGKDRDMDRSEASAVTTPATAPGTTTVPTGNSPPTTTAPTRSGSSPDTRTRPTTPATNPPPRSSITTSFSPTGCKNSSATMTAGWRTCGGSPRAARRRPPGAGPPASSPPGKRRSPCGTSPRPWPGWPRPSGWSRPTSAATPGPTATRSSGIAPNTSRNESGRPPTA